VDDRLSTACATPAIRPARPADIDALVGLEARAFATDRLSRRALRHAITTPTSALLVVEAGGLIAGYALVAFRKGAASAHLASIAVDPGRARAGIGRALVQAAEALALARGVAGLRLEVRRDNPAAIALYRRLGYRECGSCEDYYEDGETALRFEKRLGEAAPPPASATLA
jgi:ribosomal protein S18 acetylase RimI-like enzyme